MIDQINDLTQLVRQTEPAAILRASAMCDGHSILNPQALVDVGLPEPLVQQLTHTHDSDGTHKGTIQQAGQPVAEVRGVYGLHLLEFLAGALGVSYRQCLGRGSQARAIQQALLDHFERQGAEGAAAAGAT